MPQDTVNSATLPVFYGLLYVNETESNHANVKKGDNPVDIYVRCASLCAASIKHHGYAFRLLTNDRMHIEQRVAAFGLPPFETVEIAFSLNIPPKSKFYAAHYKLEVYSMFGKGLFGQLLGLIDIDTVMLAPVDLSLLESGALLGYDISDQVEPAYGKDRICRDVERVSGRAVPSVRWFGGELLLGEAECFRRLAADMFHIWPRYLEQMEYLHHVGDEMLVTSVIALASGRHPIVDGGKRGVIARWWSSRTLGPQPPFNAIKNRSVLHLPSDKGLLARLASQPFNPDSFLDAYEKGIAPSLVYRRLYNIFRRLLAGECKHAARLSA